MPSTTNRGHWRQRTLAVVVGAALVLAGAPAALAQAPTVLSGPAATTTIVTGPSSMLFINSPFTVSATVSAGAAAASGPIQFQLVRDGDGTAVSTISSTVSNGAASVTFPASALQVVSSYTVTADFLGDADFATSSQAIDVTMYQRTATVLTSGNLTQAYSTVAVPLDLSATLADVPSTPPGAPLAGLTVGFAVTSSTATLCQGAATTTVAGVATTSCVLPAGTLAGTYAITASFTATGIDLASSGSASLTVVGGPTATTPNPVVASYAAGNQTISVSTSIVAGTVSVNEGTVAFAVTGPSGSTPLCASTAVVANGVATANCVLPAGLTPGSYTVAASFSDNGGIYFPSGGTATLTLARASTSLTTRPVSGVLSATLTTAATRAPLAGETITFAFLGVSICTARTNTQGTAAAPLVCSALIILLGLILFDTPYSAAFAGDTDYAANLSTTRP